MLRLARALLPKIANARSLLPPTSRIMPLLSIIALLPGSSWAGPSADTEADKERGRRSVEQRVLDEPGRIIEQMKGSVCGTGPFYAGNVDDPIYVTPLMHPICTITATPPAQR
jgi:hypothetical protein